MNKYLYGMFDQSLFVSKGLTLTSDIDIDDKESSSKLIVKFTLIKTGRLQSYHELCE